MSKNTLNSLALGESARVLSTEQCRIKDRLFDVGLIPGATVKCMLKSPLGDPTAYLIEGALIAIRAEDSSCIEIAPPSAVRQKSV